MGYHLNKDSKGIKIFIPNFLTLIKIKNDTSYIIKPLYMLNEEERKRYRDKNDEDVIFYKQKLTGFSLGNVFDIRDTNIPMDVINDNLDPIINDNRANQIMDCLIKTIYNDGFKVKFEDFHNTTTKGYCDHANHEIVIRNGLCSLIQAKVLIHEYAHSLAHKHLENNKNDYQEHRNQYETEAEAIAYVVSKYLGMQTTEYSLSYLYTWSKQKDFKEIDDSLNTIVNYSKKIINNFEKFYNREFGLWADEYKNIVF